MTIYQCNNPKNGASWEQADYLWFKENKHREYRSRKPLPGELEEWRALEEPSSYQVYIAHVDGTLAYSIGTMKLPDDDKNIGAHFRVISGLEICKKFEIPIDLFFKDLLKGENHGLNGSCTLPKR
jgi:hypothetical protein